jgi:uncharacterized repeat protein (TIGR01451 family)
VDGDRSDQHGEETLKPEGTGGTLGDASNNMAGSQSTGDSNVLFVRQSPILSVETVGPRRITVGKVSSYEVKVQNAGQVAAEDVVVTIDLPQSAEVLATEASAGSADSLPASAGASGQVQWKVGRLEAKGIEKLVLRIVPRESRPIDLIVKWNYTPIESQAVIEVQEPKLAVQLHGPSEVLYGKAEVYRLEIANIGTGAAENVRLSLSPIGPNETRSTTHQLGTVAAGEKKAIEIELTARHAGTLTINIDAQADGGVEAQLAQDILVRRPGLAVAIEAPGLQYVNTEATYQIRVNNPGNAPAKSVKITATLPPETEYVSSTQGGRLDPNGNKVVWTADSLAPGDETSFRLTCKLRKPGSNRLGVVATAEGDVTASGEGSTRVEAIADLALAVSDPPGPVAVGSEAVYEIRVENRGTKSAENVEIIGYFSHGIEPLSAEGAGNRIGVGEVVFDPVAALDAGQSLVLKIRARAGAPGNHIFRAEVYCKPLQTRLVSEETTRFYSVAGDPYAATPTAADQNPPTSNDVQHTADQRASIASESDPKLPTPAPPRK